MGIEKVLVIGNRDIARSIVSALPSPYRISVLTWPSQTPYLPDGVSVNDITHKISDFTSSSLEAAFKGEDLLISTVSGGSYDLQTKIIEAAIAAGVRRFIPHEFGYDTMNVAVQQRLSGGVERANIIERLRNDQFEESGSFEWVGVAVGCILDSMLLNGNLGFDLAWQSGTINGTGNEVFAATSLKRVGIIVCSIIQHWEELKNRYVYAMGVMTTGNEIAAALERNTQRNWSVDHSDTGDCVREARSRIERGFLGSGMFLFERSILSDESLRAAEPFHCQSVNELFSLDPESVDGVVGQAVYDFIHHGKPICGCGS